MALWAFLVYPKYQANVPLPHAPDTLQHRLREGTPKRRPAMPSLKLNLSKDRGFRVTKGYG